MKLNIAIDGPSAAGKSTIARRLAKKLGYVHLDTGAMYRCIAYKAILSQIDLTNEEALANLIDETEIKLTPDGAIYLDGKQVQEEIRSNEISMAASSSSAFKTVREKLVARQKKMALEKGVIMDGRDIGTVVLVDAEVKIFLTATSLARAQRRYKEYQEKGISCDFNTLVEEVERRDYQDSHRENSPLRQAEDAICVDTSELTIEQVVDLIMQIIDKKAEGLA